MSADPRQWWARAEQDWAVAGRLAEADAAEREVIVFLAKEAGEKYLKTLLVLFHLPVPHSHNLRFLLKELELNLTLGEDIWEAALRLNLYGLDYRYPERAATRDDVQAAILSLGRIRSQVAQILDERAAERAG